MVDAIHQILDRADVKAPRLPHGDGELTWILIEDAVRRGLDTRVGLEDTLYLADGSRARNNAALVTAARNLVPWQVTFAPLRAAAAVIIPRA